MKYCPLSQVCQSVWCRLQSQETGTLGQKASSAPIWVEHYIFYILVDYYNLLVIYFILLLQKMHRGFNPSLL